jgi:selenide, water dikinase
MVTEDDVRLTQYSHGAGCGCKISPAVLDEMLASRLPPMSFPGLLVGNDTRDDAAVFDLGDGTGVVSTTDFFMPIVDHPETFGRIAATNAISDIYAMGGQPLMAIAILGWPVNVLPAAVARRVIDGGRVACQEAGIPLAGGHSIDSPEPIFGLAVTGRVPLESLKRNDAAVAGCELMLTKPLGVGILTTALKRGVLADEHRGLAAKVMCELNTLGQAFGRMPGIRGMTDVTGFGLMGHLLELCEGSGLSADVRFEDVPLISAARRYAEQGCLPGGTDRNFESYGHHLSEMSDLQRGLLCDPQTSGGLLLAVEPEAVDAVRAVARGEGIELTPFGRLVERESGPRITVS